MKSKYKCTQYYIKIKYKRNYTFIIYMPMIPEMIQIKKKTSVYFDTKYFRTLNNFI